MNAGSSKDEKDTKAKNKKKKVQPRKKKTKKSSDEGTLYFIFNLVFWHYGSE